ncbi:MAG: hypothetical protein H7Y17_03395 [Chlorobia bacterium]|nr:hypothetical protein [Fimbriimonadaceae bacterium]
MKLSPGNQWLIIVILLPVVVIGLRATTILNYQAWSQGYESVLGKVDDVEGNAKVRVIRYSYEVDGKPQTGVTSSRDRFTEGTSARVFYPKSGPSISTLDVGDIQGGYINSIVICVVSLLPLVLVCGARLRSWRRAATTS